MKAIIVLFLLCFSLNANSKPGDSLKKECDDIATIVVMYTKNTLETGKEDKELYNEIMKTFKEIYHETTVLNTEKYIKWSITKSSIASLSSIYNVVYGHCTTGKSLYF